MPPVEPEALPANVADLEAAFPVLITEIRTAAATAERTRIQAIGQLAEAGLEELITAAQADPACSPDAAARRILEHQRQAKAGRLALLAKDGEDPAPPAAPSPGEDKTGPAAESARLKAVVKTIHQERARAQRTS